MLAHSSRWNRFAVRSSLEVFARAGEEGAQTGEETCPRRGPRAEPAQTALGRRPVVRTAP